MSIEQTMDKFPTSIKLSKSVDSILLSDDLSKEARDDLKRSHSLSDSSIEIHVVDASSSEEETEEEDAGDSGIGDKDKSDYVLKFLGEKIDKLCDLFLEQNQMMLSIRDEIREYRFRRSEPDSPGEAVQLLDNCVLDKSSDSDVNLNENKEDSLQNRAQLLLDAIEAKRGSLDNEITEAVVNFLQSDDLKRQVVKATVDSLSDLIRAKLAQNVSSVYVPLVKRSERRMVTQITNVIEHALRDVACNTASFSRSIQQTTRNMRRALWSHQKQVEAITPRKSLIFTMQHAAEDVFEGELKEWREKVMSILLAPSDEHSERSESVVSPTPNLDYISISPQVPEPDNTFLDKLMKSAEICRMLQAGDINGSFEKALSACDLSLVMTACHCAEPAEVFTPKCRLSQSVLMSLLQQLSTDIFHDTQLKCRYLEEAIIHLNTSDSVTRSNLPMVIDQVCKHLNNFIEAHPTHSSSTRIKLIVMAANNLLK